MWREGGEKSPVGVVECVYSSRSIRTSLADPAYAQELLLHARRLFDFAFKHQAQCQISAPYYQSTGYLDELAYAAGGCVNTGL